MRSSPPCEILEFLLGDAYYDEMVADGLSFGVMELGHGA